MTGRPATTSSSTSRGVRQPPGGPADPTSPCPNTDYVVQAGPVPNDSQAWAQSRAARGQSLFAQAGLPTPAIWETPHYSASAADYAGIDQVFSTRYERGTYLRRPADRRLDRLHP